MFPWFKNSHYIGSAFFLMVLLRVAECTAFPDIMFDVGGGGGYEDNLNNAASDNQKEGSGFAHPWAVLGISNEIGARNRFFLNAGYDGTYYPSFSDLSVNAFTLRPGMLHRLNPSLLLKASPYIGIRLYGDGDRDAEVFGLSLGGSGRIHSRFTVRISYRYANHSAEVTVFSHEAHGLDVNGEVKVFPKGFLTVGYALTLGEDTFYQTETVPLPSGGHGRRPSGTFGVDQVVFKADTTAHFFSLDWDQEIYKGFYTQFGYSYVYVQSDPGNYDENRWAGGIGYRF